MRKYLIHVNIEGMDYSIAMKLPHLMKKAGLVDIGCRMNDRVNVMEPQH